MGCNPNLVVIRVANRREEYGSTSVWKLLGPVYKEKSEVVLLWGMATKLR